MEYGICLMSVAQVRQAPDDRSELVSQALFGDLVKIIDRNSNWLGIQIELDNYQGWISKGQIRIISEEDFNHFKGLPQWISNDLVQILENQSRKLSMLVSAGSSFYKCSDNSFELLGDQYIYHGQLFKPDRFDKEKITRDALMFLNAPYLWGGRSALGIDCSGFTQIVFKMSGKNILRDASQQATQGEMINLINEAQTGDLLFFDNDEGAIIHVGIMLNESHIIHAHNHVRIDMIDHHGIFNSDLKKYTHKLRLIKRI